MTELPSAEGASLLEQFSAKGVWAVALLAVSGLVISFVQMRSFGAFFETDYGIRLLIKLGLVLFIVGLAILNKTRLTARLAAAGQKMGRRPFAGLSVWNTS